MARLLDRKSRYKALFSAWFAGAALMGVLAACGDDDAATPPAKVDSGTGTETGSDASTSPSVTGTVVYTGTAQGAVSIALFKQLGGLPDYFVALPPPVTFPAPFTIKDVAPGTYKLTAYIDVGGDSKTGPGPGDPRTGPPQDVVVTAAGGPAGLTVTIRDLPPAEAGADAADDADAGDAGTD